MNAAWLECRQSSRSHCTAEVCIHDGGFLCEQDTFQVDFVVMDRNSGVFDNKGGQDYSLPLLGASTEQEILDRRAAVYEAAERERLIVSRLFLCASQWQPQASGLIIGRPLCIQDCRGMTPAGVLPSALLHSFGPLPP